MDFLPSHLISENYNKASTSSISIFLERHSRRSLILELWMKNDFLHFLFHESQLLAFTCHLWRGNMKDSALEQIKNRKNTHTYTHTSLTVTTIRANNWEYARYRVVFFIAVGLAVKLGVVCG